MKDVAFIHRIHGVVPDWKIPKVGKVDVYISKHSGFVADYFSEILHRMRGKLNSFYLLLDCENYGSKRQWALETCQLKQLESSILHQEHDGDANG